MEEPLEILYDADCRLCAAARRWTEKRDDDRRCRFVPSDPGDRSSRLLTVRDRETILSGFDGWIKILEHLPGWERRAHLLGWRPFRPIGRIVYRMVAVIRRRAPLSLRSPWYPRRRERRPK